MKCRVINCTKEAIEEHHITYYPEATTLMCSEHHEQITAQVNLKAIKQLVDIEKRCDITPSKETILKKLTPSVLLEVARTPQNKQQEALQKIDNGELKTVKDMLLIHIKQENNTINLFYQFIQGNLRKPRITHLDLEWENNEYIMR